MKTYIYTTQKQIRDAFYKEFTPYFVGLKRKPQNEQPTNVRVTFCNFVEMLHQNGEISDPLAKRVTL